MNKRILLKFSMIFFLILFPFQVSSFAQRIGYSKGEFIRRRAALMDQTKEGMIILFGEAMPQSGAHFRQDNDFYYFTGIESMNAILVMTPKTRESFLFLPQQSAREETVEGKNLLNEPKGKEIIGVTEIYPLSYFDEFIGWSYYIGPYRNEVGRGEIFYLRLSPPDFVDASRWQLREQIGRKNETHYNDYPLINDYRNSKLKEKYPTFQFKDITSFIDSMRVIKSLEEIEILRRNGRISAEGVRQAMLTTKPGIYEYEIEAASIHIVQKNGARGAAYPPIVGSGPNTCIWHYNKNSRKVEDGDLVLMDFGADLDYLCMDITRTWPALGSFTPEQKEVYQIVLEVEKACIEAYRPGITNEEVQQHVAKVMKKKGLDARGLKGGFGHFVGMGVHDVGPRPASLKEGMVFAIEPALYYPEKNIGIRIEDTVLITKKGCEVLTKDVPKEIDEIEKLMQQRKSK